METKIFIVLIVLQICHLSSAALLRLAGTVVDRGYVLSSARLEPVKNSELRVFVSETGSANWRKVMKSETLSADSKIRVAAP